MYLQPANEVWDKVMFLTGVCPREGGGSLYEVTSCLAAWSHLPSRRGVFCQVGLRGLCLEGVSGGWGVCVRDTLIQWKVFLLLYFYYLHRLWLCILSYYCFIRITLIIRWFKFTLEPTYSIAIGKLRLDIWDTSFWTFWVKFGHMGPWDIS